MPNKNKTVILGVTLMKYIRFLSMKKSLHLSLKHFALLFTFLLSVNFSHSQTVNHWETAVLSNDTWKYLVPTVEPSSSWRNLSFNDISWLSGKGGIGSGDFDDGTKISPTTSVYLRIKFNVADTSKISLGLLQMDYDDGFVAYLNNVEIARVGLIGINPAYNAFATDHEATMYRGGIPDNFLLDKKTLMNCLLKGQNVLAIQVHNSTASSGDLSSNAFLSFGIKDNSTFFRATPSWFVSPTPISNLSTYLPIISISTNGVAIPDPYKISADMKIIDHKGLTANDISEAGNVYDGKIGIEIRGSSSASYPQTPYAIETRDAAGLNLDTALLAMPRDNDWVLISNWNDKSFARNSLAYDIFTKMGHYAPRMRHCEVAINNAYRGIYLFGEKVKRAKGRVDIANLKPIDLRNDSVTGGYIFKTDYDDGFGTYWSSNFSPLNAPTATVKFVYSEPKANVIAEEQKNYISSYVNSFETVLYSTTFRNPSSGYKAYVDVNSFIDYWILQEVSRNVDGYKKSRYFYKDKASKNNLIHSGPVWDYDWAWKNLDDCFLYANTTGEGWAYDINKCGVSPTPPSWEFRMLQDPTFANAVNDRYFSLRKNILSLASINHYIDSITALVNEPQQRHYRIYNTLGYNDGAPEIDEIPTSFEGEIVKLKNWIATRLNWLDSHMVGVPSSIGGTTVNSDVRLRVFPNPVQRELYVESDNEIRRITISNSVGYTFKNIELRDYTTTINVDNLTPGLYVVKVTLADGKTFTQKLVKD